MIKFFSSPQQLLDGEVGVEVPAESAIDRQATGNRWQHYIAVARGKGGCLYVVLTGGKRPVAIWVDQLRDFAYAVDAEAHTGEDMRYFVLTSNEHAMAI